MTQSATAIVTGASSGIGQAIAARLAREGHSVLAIARTFASTPEGVEGVALDLSDLRRLPAALEELARTHPRVEVVVSNVGRGRFASLEEFSYDQIRSLVDLNFTSHAYLARAFVPAMKRRRRGRLLFIGSEASLRGSRYGAVYCASKFAVRGFAQALREEVAAAGVAVTVVNPGMVRTRFFDELGFAPGDSTEHALTAEEVADAVWLALSSRQGAVVEEVNLSPLVRVVKKAKR